uniref:Uncharacterized protein n=1 Tax=Peronospora matthiolae TaxID=2874970 RepID=A0AAV1TU58_9STRA
MRAVEEIDSLALASGDPSPALELQQQAVPVVNSSRGESPRATDTSAASAAGAATRIGDEPKSELINLASRMMHPTRRRHLITPDYPGQTLQEPGNMALGNVAASCPISSDRAIRLKNPRLKLVHLTIGRVVMVVMHQWITTREATRGIELPRASVLMLTSLKRPGT